MSIIVPPPPTPSEKPTYAPPVVPQPLTEVQRKQLFTLSPEQVRMNELNTQIHHAEIMRGIYESLCVAVLNEKGVFDPKASLGDQVARYFTSIDYRMNEVAAHAAAKRKGYKKGYQNLGDPASLRKELADLIAGGEVKSASLERKQHTPADRGFQTLNYQPPSHPTRPRCRGLSMYGIDEVEFLSNRCHNDFGLDQNHSK